jgi:hypothetical protein
MECAHCERKRQSKKELHIEIHDVKMYIYLCHLNHKEQQLLTNATNLIHNKPTLFIRGLFMGFLVGVKEASEILGWDRRKLSTYHLRGVLPKPVVSLSSGPIWFRKQIEYYKAGKESGVTTYYIEGEIVYECKHNHSIKETSYTPDEIKESKRNYNVYQEKDIKQLKSFIQEKNPIAQFLSFETISFLHDLGILETDVFHEYIHQYSFENIELTKEGRDEELC